MKLNLIIEESEKKRILSLHEQEKQDAIYTQTTFPKQKLGDTFEYGKFESNNAKQFIINLKPQIEDFMKKSGKNSFVVRISAGESQVTNPAQFKVPGSLATARAEQIKKYFEEIFPDQVKSGIIKISINKTKIGTTPYQPGDQNNPQKVGLYRQEQFVDFDIIGEGETRKPLDFCKQGRKQASGGFIPSSKNFTEMTDWNIGDGEGQFFIWSEAWSVPDIIYFEYDGKTYFDNTKYSTVGFQGNDEPKYRLLIGTALMAKFGGSKPPSQFGDTTYTKININDYITALNDLKNLDKTAYAMEESFMNIFGDGQEFANPNFMRIFGEWDKDRNNKKLIKALGTDFPWGYLTSPIRPTIQKNIPILKKDRINVIKIINIAPNGGTKWDCGTTCTKF